MPRLCQIIKDIQISKGTDGKPIVTLDFQLLQVFYATWISANPSFDNMMLWAAATVTFFSFCCSAEVTVEKKTLVIRTVIFPSIT